MKNILLDHFQSILRISVCLRCAGLIYFLSGCQTTTARFIDNRSGEIALVSTDRKESLHASTLKNGVTAAVMASVKKSTDAGAPSEIAKKFLQLAKLQLLRGEIDAAEKSAKKCLETDLKSKDAKLVLAQIYFRKGLYDLSEMILSSTEFTGTSASEMQNIRALIAFQNKNSAKSWAILEEAVRLDPSNIAARLNFGMLLLEYQLTQKAAIQFERILQLVPKQPDALLMMSMIEARRGNEKIALTTLGDLKSEYKDNPTLVFNYGSVLFHGGKYEEASDYLKSYLKLQSKKQTGVAAITEDTGRSQDAMVMIEDIRERLEEEEMTKNKDQSFMASTGLTPSNSSDTPEQEVNNPIVNAYSKTPGSQKDVNGKQSKPNDNPSPKRRTGESNHKTKHQKKNVVASEDHKRPPQEDSASASEITSNLKQNGDLEDLDRVLQN